MGANAYHHVGIRVSDLERAGRFYVEAFNGYWASSPFVMEGEMPEMIFGPHAGLRFRIAFVGFQTGFVELFEFLEPAHPTGQKPQVELGLMHFALQVPDVPAAVERAEALGASRMFPISEWGPARVCYVTDLDGNVVELIDRDMPKTIELSIGAFPEAAPPPLGEHPRRATA